MTREEELINHIREYLDSGMWEYAACYLGKKDLEIIIKALEQEPKTGHWVNTGSGQECSVCKEIQYGYDNFRNYCPNCGAKMGEYKND